MESVGKSWKVMWGSTGMTFHDFLITFLAKLFRINTLPTLSVFPSPPLHWKLLSATITFISWRHCAACMAPLLLAGVPTLNGASATDPGKNAGLSSVDAK